MTLFFDFLDALHREDEVLIGTVLSTAFQRPCRAVLTSQDLSGLEIFFRLTSNGAQFILPRHGGDKFMPVVVAERLLAYTPLFSAPTCFTANITLDLSDGANEARLASSSQHPRSVLLPDTQFLSTHAYHEQRALFTLQPNWSERSPNLFWRGSTTGIRFDPTNVMSLPRIKLCLLAQNGTDWDCKIAGLNYLHQMTPGEMQRVIAEGIVGNEVPWQKFTTFRHHVDIDGNTNSWPGLFWKLLSGGVVLKVASPFSQWYYHRLEDGVNFISVADDMSDLDTKLQWCRDNPIEAEAIGRRGRELALSLTFDGELLVAQRRLETLARLEDDMLGLEEAGRMARLEGLLQQTS